MKQSTKKMWGVSCLAAVAIGAAVGGSARTEILDYEIREENKFVSVMAVSEPSKDSVDVVELYLNNQLVGEALLPNGEFASIPLVFSGLDNLTLKFYERGQLAGEAEFTQEDKLVYKSVKGGVTE